MHLWTIQNKYTWLVIAEERLLDALAVSALKLSVGTNGFVGVKVGLDATRLGQLITVCYLAISIKKIIIRCNENIDNLLSCDIEIKVSLAICGLDIHGKLFFCCR